MTKRSKGRGMWTGLSERGKNVNIFVSHINPHQRMTSAEEDFNSQVDRMTYPMDPCQPFPSHPCHCTMDSWTKWPRRPGWRLYLNQQHGLPEGHSWGPSWLLPLWKLTLPAAETTTRVTNMAPFPRMLSSLVAGWSHWSALIMKAAAFCSYWNWHLLCIWICCPWT